jgi:hypothetical protein
MPFLFAATCETRSLTSAYGQLRRRRIVEVGTTHLSLQIALDISQATSPGVVASRLVDEMMKKTLSVVLALLDELERDDLSSFVEDGRRGWGHLRVEIPKNV